MQVRRLARWLAALSGALLVADSAPVTAQEDGASRAASLHVRGPAGCLDAATIERQIYARSGRIRLVPSAASIPRLNVDARKTVASVSVELVVTWPDTRRSSRTLAADGCEEASEAVAFLIALTLDPEASGAGATSVRAQSSSGEAAAPSGVGPDAAQPEAGAEPPTTAQQSSNDAPAREGTSAGLGRTDAGSPAHRDANAAPSEGEPTSTDADAEPTSTDAASASDFPSHFAFDGFAASAGPQLTTGVAPRIMPGVRIGALLAFRGIGIFAPALQLSAAHGWLSGLTEPGGVASFQLTTVRLDLCPLGIRARAFAVRACATTAAGSLRARGSRSYSPRASARGWLELGTSLRASLDLGSILQVSAAVALVAPIRRDQFAFRPEVFHRVDVLCLEGHLALGVRFP